MKYHIAVFACLVCFAQHFAAHAQNPLPTDGRLVQTSVFNPNKEQQKIIQEVETFLNNIKTMQAKFQQVMPMHGSVPGGTVSEGVVYLKRPGKMKWVYSIPSEVEIFLHKDRVIYHDKELDQVTYAPLEHMLASLIAQEKISLTQGDVRVIGVKRDDAGIRVTLEQTKAATTGPAQAIEEIDEKPAADEPAVEMPTAQNEPDEAVSSPQQIALTFLNPDADMFLYSMDILDEAGRNTRIEFFDVRYDATLDDAVFEFKNPRLFNPKKRN